MQQLLVKHIGMLATPEGKAARQGKAQGEIRILKDAWVLIRDGIIAEIGTGDRDVPDAEVIDAGGALVTPGLVDAHTHLVFGGWRQNELGLKLHGATYLDILAMGGGILSTVNATRAATEEALYDKAREALDEMLSLGVTTVEAKSGYGLDLENELKQLRVIRRLAEEHPMDVAATFLGAHAVPTEYKADRQAYIRLLCEEVIPAVAKEDLAEFCDVFCETGVFSAEHLIVCPPAGIAAMAKAGTVACCLPATSFYLGSTFAPVRAMIEAGVPVAMASDFNPGSCPSLNLQFVMNLGCLRYRMTPEEVLTAVTLNGAAAIRRADKLGSLEVGKQGDLVIWNAPDLNYICYRMGSNLVRTVIKKGRPF